MCIFVQTQSYALGCPNPYFDVEHRIYYKIISYKKRCEIAWKTTKTGIRKNDILDKNRPILTIFRLILTFFFIVFNNKREGNFENDVFWKRGLKNWRFSRSSLQKMASLHIDLYRGVFQSVKKRLHRFCFKRVEIWTILTLYTSICTGVFDVFFFQKTCFGFEKHEKTKNTCFLSKNDVFFCLFFLKIEKQLND